MIGDARPRSGLQAVALVAGAIAVLVVVMLYWDAARWIALGGVLGGIGLAPFLYVAATRWRPAALLAAITPLEGILFTYLGAVSHLVTPILALAFVFDVRARLFAAFLATGTQKLVALFVIALAPSYLGAFVAARWEWFVHYGQKIGLLIVVGVFSVAMVDQRRMELVAKLLVISSAVFVLLSLLEFYWGIKILPSGQLTWGKSAILGSLEEQMERGAFSHQLRLRGLAGSASPNQFAARLVLPFFLGLAWFRTARTPSGKALAWAGVALVSAGVMAAVSRSAFLSILVGVPVMFSLFRFRNAASLLLVLALMAGTGYLLATSLVGDIAWRRFAGSEVFTDVARLELWSDALTRIREGHLLVGIGYHEFFEGGEVNVHNSYLTVMLVQGLVALVPALLLFAYVLQVMRRPSLRLTPELSVWRRAFLAGFVAMLVGNLFNEYLYDRALWIAIAFAASLEMMARRRAPQP